MKCLDKDQCEICKGDMVPTLKAQRCRDKIKNCMNEHYEMNNNFDIVCTECAPGFFLTEEGECEACSSSPFLS